jgi:hypothetical protein
MSFYAGLQSTASRLLEQFGQVVTFKRTTGGGIDPVTGQDTTTTDTLETVGVLRRYPDSLIDGTRIQATDRELVVRATDLTPVINDSVTVNGEEFTIEDINTSTPAGTDLVYFVRVRR